MNQIIYTIESPSKEMAELRYTVPLTAFQLEDDANITALHIAEHCAFGDYDRNEYFQAEAEKLGGSYLEASINKTWLSFHILFKSKYLNEAVKLFLEFIDGLENEIKPKILEHYAAEVKEELLENKDEYEEMDMARAYLIDNTPFMLSSGGQVQYTGKIKLEEIKDHLSVIAKSGVITLTALKSQFSKLNCKNTLISELQPLAKINIKIKNEYYLSDKLASFVLPKLNEKNTLELLYSFDYLIHKSKAKRFKISVSDYPTSTIINLFHTGKKDLFAFAQKAKKIDPAEIEKDVVKSIKEHFKLIENVSRFAIADWINKKATKSADISDKISMILLKILSFKQKMEVK